MHFYRRLPEGFAELRAWSIYDLVDDWILRSTFKPGRQILLYLSAVAVVAGGMIWVTITVTAFPEIGIWTYVIIQVILLFVTIAVHEICHAMLIVYYGGRPKFGAKWLKGLGPVVYVTTKGLFTVHAYRRIAAAPLVLISAGCVLGIFFGLGWWLFTPFIFNAIGAGGDLLSLRVLRRYPENFLIQDTQDGFIAYSNAVYETMNV